MDEVQTHLLDADIRETVSDLHERIALTLEALVASEACLMNSMKYIRECMFDTSHFAEVLFPDRDPRLDFAIHWVGPFEDNSADLGLVPASHPMNFFQVQWSKQCVILEALFSVVWGDCLQKYSNLSRSTAVIAELEEVFLFHHSLFSVP